MYIDPAMKEIRESGMTLADRRAFVRTLMQIKQIRVTFSK